MQNKARTAQLVFHDNVNQLIWLISFLLFGLLIIGIIRSVNVVEAEGQPGGPSQATYASAFTQRSLDSIPLSDSSLACPADIISYWQLDETAGQTFIDSVGRNNASCTNPGCPDFATGKVNGALSFNGSTNGLTVTNHPDLNWALTDSFSIEAWVKTTQDCTGNKVYVGKHSNGPSWWLGCRGGPNAGNAVFSVRAGLGTLKDVGGTSVINNGEWHHLVGVRDSATDTIRIYVDGALQGSLPASYTENFANNNPLTMGFHANAYRVDGLIDEVAVYGRALSLADIQENFARGSAGVPYCVGTEAPSITSTPVTTAAAGQPYNYQVTATGWPKPEFSLTTAPAGMTIDTNTGLISWTPPSLGDFDVTVQASNSAGNAVQNFTITVMAPVAPSITSTPVVTATVGQVYTYDVDATGTPDPTYSLSVAPAGMSINASTGLIVWVPETGGAFPVTVRASNSAGNADQSFTITATKAPTITSTAITSAAVGQPYTYDVDASGHPTPTYSLITAPAGMTINATTGLITWTPGAAGSFPVTVRASNSVGNADQSFTIIVTSTQAPAITSTPVTTVVLGYPYSYDVDASGAPAPTFSLLTAPPGMTINATTGLISWNPTTAGSFNVTVRASNSAGNADQSFTITVTQAPTITSTPVTAAVAGQPYSYDVNASGSPAPTYALITAPSGMTINAATGVISWAPDTAGSFNVTVRASNSAGNATQSFTITVTPPQHFLYLPITMKNP